MEIVPYEGYEASLSRDELEKARRERAKHLLLAAKSIVARFAKERKKSDPYYLLVATEDKNPFRVNILHFLDSPLQMIHLVLKSEFIPSRKHAPYHLYSKTAF